MSKVNVGADGDEQLTGDALRLWDRDPVHLWSRPQSNAGSMLNRTVWEIKINACERRMMLKVMEDLAACRAPAAGLVSLY